MRCGAAQASCQGKYSPAFKGSWLRAWTTEAMELPFELANGVLLFCFRRKQRNSPGALLCCAICGTRFNKGLCGREHRRERERRQVGGAGSCIAPESTGVQHADRDELREAGQPGHRSPLCPLLLGAGYRAGPEEPSLGTARQRRGKAQPSLPECVATKQPPPVQGAGMLCLWAPQLLPASP